MIVTVVYEGFANQLYRYCAAYALAKQLGDDLVLVAQTSQAISDPFQLSEFKIECSEIITTKTQIETKQVIDNLQREYNLKKISEANYNWCFENSIYDQYGGILLDGHFQSILCFNVFMDDIKNMLQFETESSFLQLFKREINGKQSVGIHVRRGDYLFYYGHTGEMTYYKAAMCAIEQRIGIGNAEYYVFSDDQDAVKASLGYNCRIHYVSNYGNFREAIEEFQALTQCKHHIFTSASSYSRMADILKPDESGITIYDALGFEFFVERVEKVTFLDKETIEQLAVYYDEIFVDNDGGINKDTQEQDKIYGIDTYFVTKEMEMEIRRDKIRHEMECGNYHIALGQVRKYWEFMIGRGDEIEQEMHQLFFECLYKEGFLHESLIESLYLPELPVEDYYDAELCEIRNKLFKKRKKIVIVPERYYNPMWYEEIVHMGILLRRIGFEVTFLFKELSEDMEKYVPFNTKLRTMAEFVKTRGINTKCNQLSLVQEINKHGSLLACLANLAEEECVFIVKERYILESIERINSDNAKTLFWDYTNIYDPGNFSETGDRIVLTKALVSDIQYCYKHADYVVTYTDDLSINTSVIYMENDINQDIDRTTISDFDALSDVVVKNAIRLAEVLM